MWKEIFGLDKKQPGLVGLITPQRSFADVVLPEETRRQLFDALTQIRKHRLIFEDWGLGERHPEGAGLAFNFAGPPGTGKTICAEAVAYALGRKLLRVDYAELESCWVGVTGKNIRSVFRDAKAQEAVLFFDEADSIATRRFSNVIAGHEREANLSVNILLKELEGYTGVVIFATNMAANFDPAFERRIRTHILFKVPGPAEREQIWRVQVHPEKTPLGSDVDFAELGDMFEVTGGDIRNAVLRAAQMAAGEEGPDETKRILQRHFNLAMEDVLSGRETMRQNAVVPRGLEYAWEEAVTQAKTRLSDLDDDVSACQTELELVTGEQERLTQQVQELSAQTTERLAAIEPRLTDLSEDLRARLDELAGTQTTAIQTIEESAATRDTQLEELKQRLEAAQAALETRLAGATIIPWPRRTSVTVGVIWLLLTIVGATGWLGR